MVYSWRFSDVQLGCFGAFQQCSGNVQTRVEAPEYLWNRRDYPLTSFYSAIVGWSSRILPLQSSCTRYQWRDYNHGGVSPLLDISAHGFTEEKLDKPLNIQSSSHAAYVVGGV